MDRSFSYTPVTLFTDVSMALAVRGTVGALGEHTATAYSPVQANASL